MAHMSRTHVRRRRLGALLVTAGMLAALAGTARSALGQDSGSAFVADRRYVVRSGDSLWSIARRRGPGADPRALVDAIWEVNGLGNAALTPGQHLVIPASG
jgi:nucleoid-associated protein YgaU